MCELFSDEDKTFHVENQNDVVMLWIGEKLPILQQHSIKSLLLTNHNVNFYTYRDYPELEQFKSFDNFNHGDANDIVHEDDIWTYKVSAHGKGSYAGFANHWRLIYLLKNGGTWVDSDVIAIRNVEDFGRNQIMIAAEILDKRNMKDKANNNLLSFPKNDFLIEEMEALCSEVKDNAKFGETGPSSLRKHLRKFPIYQPCLLSYRAVCPVPSYNYKHYSTMTPEEVYKANDLNSDSVFGFHIWNTRFNHHNPRGTNLTDKLTPGSLYDCLEKAIQSSKNSDEYVTKLKEYKIR